jgi:hypothetical protein
MTEQPQSRIGTVAEEVARLIEDVATMARSSASVRADPNPYAGGPAQEPASPDAPPAVPPEDDPAVTGGPSGPPPAGDCSRCGGERDGTPVACRLCPVCQGIALLRSVRPETVDRLADLASAVAETLRDLATQSRASASAGRPSDHGRAAQDIPVNDDNEG